VASIPVAFKLKASKRVQRGEAVSPVARDLGMTRTAPHDWLRVFKAFGPEGLNYMRGPKIAAAPVAELERVIGRQQLELEFFSASLPRLGRNTSASVVPPLRNHQRDVGNPPTLKYGAGAEQGNFAQSPSER
jgi:transposase-like protein